MLFLPPELFPLKASAEGALLFERKVGDPGEEGAKAWGHLAQDRRTQRHSEGLPRAAGPLDFPREPTAVSAVLRPWELGKGLFRIRIRIQAGRPGDLVPQAGARETSSAK